MSNNVLTYVLGSRNVPDWVNSEAEAGRIKISYNDDAEIEYAKVASGNKEYNAKVGDTIVKSKSGLVVIPKDKAKKYMPTSKPTPKKVEEDIKEEEAKEEE